MARTPHIPKYGAQWEHGITSHIPPPFHLTSHFQTQPRCLASSGRVMFRIVRGGNRDRAFRHQHGPNVGLFLDECKMNALRSVAKKQSTFARRRTIRSVGPWRSQSRRTVRYLRRRSCLRGSRMAASRGRSSHLAITRQPTFTKVPGRCLDGLGGDDRVLGERGVGTVRRDGSVSRCPRPDPRHVSMPHDGICSADDPEARGGGAAHPRWMHFSLPAGGCWFQ